MRREIRLERRRIEPDRLIAHGDQLAFDARVCCGKQGDLMAEIDQGIGEMRHYPLGPAIQFRRHRLVQGRNLRDSHVFSLDAGLQAPIIESNIALSASTVCALANIHLENDRDS
ncbi:hypothetical protein D3C83_25850 [compost metagenome]